MFANCGRESVVSALQKAQAGAKDHSLPTLSADCSRLLMAFLHAVDFSFVGLRSARVRYESNFWPTWEAQFLAAVVPVADPKPMKRRKRHAAQGSNAVGRVCKVCFQPVSGHARNGYSLVH
jgi:hypothetical protein